MDINYENIICSIIMSHIYAVINLIVSNKLGEFQAKYFSIFLLTIKTHGAPQNSTWMPHKLPFP